MVILFLIESIIAAMEEKLWPETSSRFKELEDILNGMHPQYSTYKLKNRLIKEELIQN